MIRKFNIEILLIQYQCNILLYFFDICIVSIKIQPLYKPRSRLIEAENCQLQDNFILEFVMFMN